MKIVKLISSDVILRKLPQLSVLQLPYMCREIRSVSLSLVNNLRRRDDQKMFNGGKCCCNYKNVTRSQVSTSYYNTWGNFKSALNRRAVKHKQAYIINEVLEAELKLICLMHRFSGGKDIFELFFFLHSVQSFHIMMDLMWIFSRDFGQNLAKNLLTFIFVSSAARH